LLDGCPSPGELAQAAAAAGYSALALTDHNALYGVIEFYDACQEAGIQSIIGMELTVALDRVPSRAQTTLDFDQTAQETGESDPVAVALERLVLLAQDMAGYANLCRLSSALQARPDREAAIQRGLPISEMQGRTDGLIALGGGKHGRLAHLVQTGHDREAKAMAAVWLELFGQDSFFVELQIQTADDSQFASRLAGLAKRVSAGTVATNNVHYLAPSDEDQCRLLRALDTLQLLDRTASRPGLHLSSPEEIQAAFARFPEALANTAAIAERCRLELPLGQPVFPRIELPAGRTPQDELRAQSLAGAEKRYGIVTQAVGDRLEHEIAIIDSTGYTPLFLIVADIVRYAREQGIPVNLRGSAAGSLVIYCLGVSAVDPLALDLRFERFLNPERRDPPDIDLDLCSRRRDEVIQYVYQRYGQDRVATICTYARFRARSAWREVAKAYHLSQERVDAVAKEIPRFWHPGRGPEIATAKERLLEAAQDVREREALEAAWGLDGHPRHLSLHPGGIVIAPRTLTELAPLQLATKGIIITQFDLHGIERLGLVKIDLLGIRALTVVAESVGLVQRQLPEFSRESIPRDDSATGDLLAQADTIGCFQVESPGMRRTLLELGARSLEDLTVAMALYKPGPMRGGLKDAFVRRHRGQEAVHYLHPALEPVLESTHGVVLYQEQVLRIAHELAGFSLGESDRLRRAIAHLGHGAEMMPLRDEFIQRVGRVSQVPPDVAARLWELMASFAGYGFLKAHAASYATVAYQTAYLKAHHPAEFMTAVLGNWGGYYPQQFYLEEARRMGMLLRPPHINHSQRRFALRHGSENRRLLWMGLGQVRELTRRTIAALLTARQERPFESLDDLLQRAEPSRTEAENLVKAGALDRLGTGRKALLSELSVRAPGAPLQLALPWAEAPVEEFSLAEMLALEVETLGWPVSAHPLAPFVQGLAIQGRVRSDQFDEHAGRRIMVAGARLRVWGERRGRVSMGDEAGFFRLRMPPGQRLQPGSLGKLGPYRARGRVQMDSRGAATILVEKIEPL
jgi:DNA-directed DNA polymerase III PolC